MTNPNSTPPNPYSYHPDGGNGAPQGQQNTPAAAPPTPPPGQGFYGPGSAAGMPPAGMPQTGAPNYAGMQQPPQPQKKKKNGCLIAGIIGAVLFIALIIVAAVFVVPMISRMFFLSPPEIQTGPLPTASISTSSGARAGTNTDVEAAKVSAQRYADLLNLSKKDLQEQLVTYDSFTPETAQEAIESLDIDWKENALKQAEVYVNEMDMPINQVYEQLTSEYGGQFTSEEAQYAVDTLTKRSGG